ncbi:MAG: hypothetical protein KKH52_02750, partial [Nanoarchaeota archaeon]|nr:hypothetical protein [Nanoarchaeota archaeon]
MYKKRYKVDKVRFSHRKNFNKKGQITVFIIIGIILLLALGLIIALKQEVIKFESEEAIPTEKGKVESFLTSCLLDLGEEALDQIGLQGGYIDVPLGIAEDPDRHLKLSPMHVVPYWAYHESENIPSLEQIEQRINLYIEENLRDCLFSQEAFLSTYDLIEKSDLTADTKSSDTKVVFNVHWDVEVRDKAGEVVSEVINHVAESKIKLKRVHQTAVRIVETEMLELKLEDLTQDLIALEHPNVPAAGLELSCQRKEWNVNDAKNTLQDLLRVNLKQLKVSGTEIIEFPDQFPYYQSHYQWDLGNDFVMPQVDVVFNYDNNYPFTFQVSPSQGGKMFSGMMGGDDLISYLCVQTWKFTYDVVYPVMVRVKDTTTGYNFNLAFTVHLINNLANRAGEVEPKLPPTTSFVSDNEFCRNKRIPMTVLTWELIDNGKEVYFTEPLEDVHIKFTCLRHACELGETEFDFANSGYQAGQIFDFPYCVGGIIRAQKEGYKDDWVRVVTTNGAMSELNLVPLLAVPLEKFSIVRHELSGETLGPGV